VLWDAHAPDVGNNAVPFFELNAIGQAYPTTSNSDTYVWLVCPVASMAKP
jgi:hypothetical protein